MISWNAVAIWSVTGQGVKNTKWPAVPYSRWISQNRKILANLNYHMSIKTSQAILKCFMDLKSSVFQKQQTQLTRGDFSRRMSAEAVMTSNVACHAMLWTENSNEHPDSRQTKTWYRNPTKPAGLIRITSYDGSGRLNFFYLWNLLRIWDCRPFSVLKTLTGYRRYSHSDDIIAQLLRAS